MQLKGNYVLVKADDPEKVSQGGIIIPEVAQREGMIGTVVAVGDGTYVRTSKVNEEDHSISYTYELRPIDSSIRPGVKIVYPRWAGYPFEFEEEEYLLVKEWDILAVIEEEAH